MKMLLCKPFGQLPIWRSVKGMVLLCTCFFSTITSSYSQQAVTGIVTDYLGYFKTTSLIVNPVKPVNNHNLLAFTYKGVQYSTGVNDSRLSSHLETYVQSDFWSLPVSGYSGTVNYDTKVGVGEMFDGVHNGASNPPPENSITRYLTDGVKGLNIGTCIANLPVGTMSFFVSNIKSSCIGDGIPDILVTQVADPSGTFDRYSFVDANNQTIGVSRDIVFTNITPVGYWTADFYEASQHPLTLTPVFTNTDRPIRVWAADLSDFGITAANYASIRKFQINLSGKSDVAFASYNNRTFNVTVVLPVKLTAFTAIESNGKGLLHWQTTDEINSRDFAIEKSTDGMDFTAIGTVAAANTGSSSNRYSFVDQSLQTGISYYRLKIRDVGDRYVYSSIVQIRSSSTTRSLSVFPNPAAGFVTINHPVSTLPGFIRVFNGQGSLVRHLEINAGTGYTTIGLEGLAKAVYHVTIQQANKRTTMSFVKK